MKILQILGCRIRVHQDIDHTPYSIPAIGYNLTEELVERGHEVALFATSDSQTSATVPEGLLSSQDKRFKKYARNSPAVEHLYKKHFQRAAKIANQFNIVHTHYLDFIRYANNVQTPIVATLHSPDVPRGLFPHLKKKKNLHLVAISKKQKENNREVPFSGCVYNGIRIKEFPFSGVPKKYLCWLGRFSPLKGTKEAILLAAQTKNQLILAGNIEENDREYADQMLALIKKYPNIKYIGPVEHKEKINLLKNAQALILPLRWEEPFGIVMVEAMACGTPVIALKKGAAPEIVQHGKTGFLADTLDQMVRYIKKIPNIHRQNCRKRVEKYFTVEKMAEGYEKIYYEIISKS